MASAKSISIPTGVVMGENLIIWNSSLCAEMLDYLNKCDIVATNCMQMQIKVEIIKCL